MTVFLEGLRHRKRSPRSVDEVRLGDCVVVRQRSRRTAVDCGTCVLPWVPRSLNRTMTGAWCRSLVQKMVEDISMGGELMATIGDVLYEFAAISPAAFEVGYPGWCAVCAVRGLWVICSRLVTSCSIVIGLIWIWLSSCSYADVCCVGPVGVATDGSRWWYQPSTGYPTRSSFSGTRRSASLVSWSAPGPEISSHLRSDSTSSSARATSADDL